MEYLYSKSPAIPPELKVLVNVDEAAVLLSLGRTMVYRLVMEGTIPTLSLGELGAFQSQPYARTWIGCSNFRGSV